MAWRPPLTHTDLETIYAARRDDADIVRLLWEIARLREVARLADALVQVLPSSPPHSAAGQAAQKLRDVLADEPSISRPNIRGRPPRREMIHVGMPLGASAVCSKILKTSPLRGVRSNPPCRYLAQTVNFALQIRGIRSLGKRQ